MLIGRTLISVKIWLVWILKVVLQNFISVYPKRIVVDIVCMIVNVEVATIFNFEVDVAQLLVKIRIVFLIKMVQLSHDWTENVVIIVLEEVLVMDDDV